jgi:uncharacterized protein
VNAAFVSGSRGLRLRCRIPERGRERLRGLIGHGGLAHDEAFLIANATSVHTYWMRFPILIARLDDSLRVVDVRVVRPWRFVGSIRRARHVLECHEGTDIRVGDALLVAWAADRERWEVESAGERADEGQDERRADRQRSHHDREKAARPRGERDGLPSSALRLDDPEELQQRSHR